jgi:CRP-like cAMP-binding protein
MTSPDAFLVRDFEIFKNLAEQDLRAILATSRMRRVPKKSTVFEQGQPAAEFFVLLHGHLKVAQTTPDGQQIIVRIVSPGEIYGVAVALGRSDYPGTAIAMEDSITLAWPSSSWDGLVRRQPALAVNALHSVGQRLQEAHTRIRESSTEEVERRVAHLLLRIIAQGGERTSEGIRIDFPITRQDVAEMTGTTLHTVSRVLSAWEQQGLVAGGREKITVKDPAGLAAMAERMPDQATSRHRR